MEAATAAHVAYTPIHEDKKTPQGVPAAILSYFPACWITGFLVQLLPAVLPHGQPPELPKVPERELPREIRVRH